MSAYTDYVDGSGRWPALLVGDTALGLVGFAAEADAEVVCAECGVSFGRTEDDREALFEHWQAAHG